MTGHESDHDDPSRDSGPGADARDGGEPDRDASNEAGEPDGHRPDDGRPDWSVPDDDDGDSTEQSRTSDDIPQRPTGETALLLDTMLGKLATYLRMCGYDAAYAGERGIEADDDVLAVAHTEGRLLVTRDRELAARADRSQLLSTREVTEQLRQLHRAGFDLELADEPARCSACNGPLERVDRTEPTPDYAPETHEDTVWRCRDCGQHFWKGSHWDNVARTLDRL